jgi:hypothetical protein
VYACVHVCGCVVCFMCVAVCDIFYIDALNSSSFVLGGDNDQLKEVHA